MLNCTLRNVQKEEALAELFTREELEEIQQRALQLATEHEESAGLRAALQLLGEAAGNVIPKVVAEERT